MDCVEVCPVDCFYEGENMIVINPEECIDCGVCQPECPADAILPDTKLDAVLSDYWKNFNQKYANMWPNITKRRKEDVPADADNWLYVENKVEEHFSEKPGKGDQPEEDE